MPWLFHVPEYHLEPGVPKHQRGMWLFQNPCSTFGHDEEDRQACPARALGQARQRGVAIFGYSKCNIIQDITNIFFYLFFHLRVWFLTLIKPRFTLPITCKQELHGSLLSVNLISQLMGLQDLQEVRNNVVVWNHVKLIPMWNIVRQ